MYTILTTLHLFSIRKPCESISCLKRWRTRKASNFLSGAPFPASKPAERTAFRPVRIIAGVQMVVHYDEGICSLSVLKAKTKGSQRQIPLVGESLWATQRIKANPRQTFAFPRYNTTPSTNANSASATTNKWLKPRVPEGSVIHSFRHDRPDKRGDGEHRWCRSSLWGRVWACRREGVVAKSH